MTTETTRREYLNIRTSQPNWQFSQKDIDSIERFYIENKIIYNKRHSCLNFGNPPDTFLQDKGISDYMSIMLWNEIMPSKYSIDSLVHLRSVADAVIYDLNETFPNGAGMDEEHMIMFVTASSASSFLGIQNPIHSRFCMDSLKKTLSAHCDPRIVHKPWLFDNLREIESQISLKPSIIDRDYGQLCLNAKASSSSIKGEGNFRDYVIQHTLNEVIDQLDEVGFLIYAGFRLDRRGKYRLICSMDGRFRIVDYLLNNGSYDLCSHGGMFSQYTTEGFNTTKLWAQLARMSHRGDYTMICLDYSGYDTQISLQEYLGFTNMLNRYRVDDELYGPMLQWYSNWMTQPKPLVTKTLSGYEILIEFYRTLASGLHGTHSFQNLIGISTYLQAVKLGIKCGGFWTNGDDQNAFVYTRQVQEFLKFIKNYFLINELKSLIGHKLTVWSKLWFAEDFHPMWEVGTFRSIWEREGGSTETVESSKFESNYCKILQVMITLMRLGKSERTVRYWMTMLCDSCDPKINPNLVPSTLHNLSIISQKSSKGRRPPKGLDSSKSYLISKDLDIKIFGVGNYYDMLLSMYNFKQIFSLDTKNVSYYPKGTVLKIESGFDYSYDITKGVPFSLQMLYKLDNLSPERNFIRSVLQSTKSFDGPVFSDYHFDDMFSLAVCINQRNTKAWSSMSWK